jgi:hypothetical protein
MDRDPDDRHGMGLSEPAKGVGYYEYNELVVIFVGVNAVFGVRLFWREVPRLGSSRQRDGAWCFD